MYCVEFRFEYQQRTKKLFFIMDQTEKIMLLKNEWISNTLLNKAGLA